ncbi:hypothetical protein BSLA_03r1427 [Burkholderia stabilis]|nr:hypothetical protein BSLA_03r1427 [Burkholderia stabilis]
MAPTNTSVPIAYLIIGDFSLGLPVATTQMDGLAIAASFHWSVILSEKRFPFWKVIENGTADLFLNVYETGIDT